MKTYMHFRESKRELIPVELDKSAVLVHEMLKFQLATKIKQKYHVHSTNLNFKVLVNLIFENFSFFENREVEICNMYEYSYVYVYNSYMYTYPFFVFYIS